MQRAFNRSDMRDGGSSSPFEEFFGCSSPFGSVPEKEVKKAPAIETKVLCSLEELYKGTTKKIKISSRTTQVEEILTINVKPGWKKGTKITFAENGNEALGIIPADIVFIIDEKPHPAFTRDGDDLVVTHKVSLPEALTTGCTVRATMLDGRGLTVPVRPVIHPRHEEVVRGEGMPLPKNPSRKGSLRIRFDIQFPTELTASQRSGVTRLLGLQRDTNKDDGPGDGASMAVDSSRTPCRQATQAATGTMAATHGEDSRPGRVIYVGSMPVRLGSG